MNPQSFNIKLSAPGKVILFGEYSVVFKKPAVAAALSLRTELRLQKTTSDTIQLILPQIQLNKSFALKDVVENFNVDQENSWDGYLQSLTKAFECLYAKTEDGCALTDSQKFALIAFFHCFGKIFNSSGGFCLQIDSQLPVGAGVGSSASFSVVLSASALLLEHFNKSTDTHDFIDGCGNITEKFRSRISELAFSCEKIFHGSPSGVDHNTILHGSIMEFIKSEDNNNNKMTFIKTKPIQILLVNTNVPRSTKKLVANFKQLRENHPEIIDCVLNGMENVAKSAVKDLKEFNECQTDSSKLEAHFEDLVSLNHNLLRVLGTSHPSLELIVSTANKYNLKAKLTGSGGGGFGFIYIPSKVETSVIGNIKKELTAAGFTVYDVSLGGPGLIIEELHV